MNRKLIFVFILLITLFMVDSRPLKRATKFKKCRNGPPQLKVKLSPDPLKPGENNTFTISGKLKLPVTKFDNLFIALSDPKNGDLLDSFGVPICETGLKCPVDDGTEFTTKVVYSIPANITEKTFDVLVGITSPPNHIIGCATTSDDS